MVRLMFDASGLAKRYAPEPGTPLVNHIFRVVKAERMMCLMLGAGEVASVLVRKRNRGTISQDAFVLAKDELLQEVVRSGDFTTLPIYNDQVEAALALVETYSLNVTDAVLLRSAIENQAALRLVGDSLVLIASDERLLRAAKAEGIPCFDPERQSQQELDALVGAP